MMLWLFLNAGLWYGKGRGTNVSWGERERTKEKFRRWSWTKSRWVDQHWAGQGLDIAESAYHEWSPDVSKRLWAHLPQTTEEPCSLKHTVMAEFIQSATNTNQLTQDQIIPYISDWRRTVVGLTSKPKLSDRFYSLCSGSFGSHYLCSACLTHLHGSRSPEGPPVAVLHHIKRPENKPQTSK